MSSLRTLMEYLGTGRGPLYTQGADTSGGPWGYMVWLGFLLVTPLSGGGSAQVWWATSAAVVVFVPAHLWGFNQTGPRLWLSRAVMFIIGAALFPYNAFAHTFFIYAGLPGGRAGVRESLLIIGTTLLASYLYFFVTRLPAEYFILTTVLIVGFEAVMLTARAGRASQLALAGKDVEIARLAKIAERERIARDMHDLLGHTLSVIAVKSELAHKVMRQDAERAADEMRDVAKVARQALSEVRQAIAGLRSLGLLDAVRAVDTMLRAAGLEVSQNLQGLPALSAAQEHAAAQVVLEAGTNIVRHAQAKHVAIEIGAREAEFWVQIDDDGRGGDIVPGNGLNGMRQRLQAVQGSLQVTPLHPGLRVRAIMAL